MKFVHAELRDLGLASAAPLTRGGLSIGEMSPRSEGAVNSTLHTGQSRVRREREIGVCLVARQRTTLLLDQVAAKELAVEV